MLSFHRTFPIFFFIIHVQVFKKQFSHSPSLIQLVPDIKKPAPYHFMIPSTILPYIMQFFIVIKSGLCHDCSLLINVSIAMSVTALFCSWKWNRVCLIKIYCTKLKVALMYILSGENAYRVFYGAKSHRGFWRECWEPFCENKTEFYRSNGAIWKHVLKRKRSEIFTFFMPHKSSASLRHKIYDDLKRRLQLERLMRLFHCWIKNNE